MPADQPGQGSLKPTALSVADAAKVLTKTGGKVVTEAMLRQDIEAGAPVNPDGTINLLHYAAWLVRELAHAD
jgi:hypothetical protein